MEKYVKFRQLLLNIGQEELGSLCEKFLYDHEGAIQSTGNIASVGNLKLNSQEIKDFITEMHEKGDFDDVNCFSTPLYENELYKKFHPDKLSTASK
jgi:hypothetical protein